MARNPFFEYKFSCNWFIIDTNPSRKGSVHMSNKLILAVLQEDDYDAVVTALNQEHFFVTRLSSSGGFLRRKNITIMIGVQDEEQEKVVSILKANASKRKQTIRKMPITLAGAHGLEAGAAVPVEIDVGGVTVFTIPLDGIQKF
jgi:uncharacterized protein YaaQ